MGVVWSYSSPHLPYLSRHPFQYQNTLKDVVQGFNSFGKANWDCFWWFLFLYLRCHPERKPGDKAFVALSVTLNSGKIHCRERTPNSPCLDMYWPTASTYKAGWIVVQTICTGLPEPWVTRENDSSLAFFVICSCRIRGISGLTELLRRQSWKNQLIQDPKFVR